MDQSAIQGQADTVGFCPQPEFRPDHDAPPIGAFDIGLADYRCGCGGSCTLGAIVKGLIKALHSGQWLVVSYSLKGTGGGCGDSEAEIAYTARYARVLAAQMSSRRGHTQRSSAATTEMVGR